MAVTILTGMSNAQLKDALQKAQAAYVELVTGKKGSSFSYTQGDGTRSVTYTQTSVADLITFIQALQMELGVNPGRRAIRFRF